MRDPSVRYKISHGVTGRLQQYPALLPFDYLYRIEQDVDKLVGFTTLSIVDISLQQRPSQPSPALCNN